MARHTLFTLMGLFLLVALSGPRWSRAAPATMPVRDDWARAWLAAAQDCAWVGSIAYGEEGRYLSIMDCVPDTPPTGGAQIISTPTPPPLPAATPRPTNTPAPTQTLPATATPRPTATLRPGATRRVVPDSYPNITAAANAAAPGDTIAVRSGVYGESVPLLKDGLTLEPYGDGPVWLDGGCTRSNGVGIAAHDVTVRGIGIRNTLHKGVYINGRDYPAPNRATVQNMTIQDWNCTDQAKGVADESWAGIHGHYAGMGHRFLDNYIQRRVNLPGAQRGFGNGILIQNDSSRPSGGGGHTISGNYIRGGFDCIGSQKEDDALGGFTRDTLIENNHVEDCFDDGIQVEGGNVNIMVRGNQIFNSQGFGIAPNLTGPLYLEDNYVRNPGITGAYDTMYGLKVGNSGAGTAYLSRNIFHFDTGPDSTGVLREANVVSQTNSGLQGFVFTDNVLIGTRYVIEFTGPLTQPSSFNDACHYSIRDTISQPMYKFNNQQYFSLTAARAATGYGITAQWGNCTYTAPAPLPVPARVPEMGSLPPSPTPAPTMTATPRPAGQAQFLTDTFSDAAAADVTARFADDGSRWAYHPRNAGTLQVSTGYLRLGSVGALIMAGSAPATAEYDVEAVVYQVGSAGGNPQYTGPAGRIDPAADSGYWVYSTGVQWRLVRFLNGSETTLGTCSHTLVSGASYTVRLELRNAEKRAYVDNAFCTSSTDNAVSAPGRAGVSLYSPNRHYIDRVTATDR